jgi:hypothetical protein
MKTSLAIATAALMFSAVLSLTSVGSAAEYGSYAGKSPGRCGVVPCPSQQQVEQTSWSTPSTSYRGLR